MACQIKAELGKRSNILEFEGRHEAAYCDTEVREREVEAKVTNMASGTINGGSVQANNYYIAQKYIDTLKDITSTRNQKGIMMPMEVTGILDSVAGIAKIAKKAFKSLDDTPPSDRPWGERDS